METFITGPSGLPVAKTIEFVGVGPAGKRRPIDAFDDVSQGSFRRVNLVAPPDQGWLSLFNQWASTYNLHVSISIRSGNDVVLILKEVTPLHLSISVLDGTDFKTAKALISIRGEQVVFARARPVVASRWDRYMPASVWRGIPSR
jgi:hypothetical protein